MEGGMLAGLCQVQKLLWSAVCQKPPYFEEQIQTKGRGTLFKPIFYFLATHNVPNIFYKTKIMC